MEIVNFDWLNMEDMGSSKNNDSVYHPHSRSEAETGSYSKCKNSFGLSKLQIKQIMGYMNFDWLNRMHLKIIKVWENTDRCISVYVEGHDGHFFIYKKENIVSVPYWLEQNVRSHFETTKDDHTYEIGMPSTKLQDIYQTLIDMGIKKENIKSTESYWIL
jgi:hypothetical protein